MAGTHAAGDGKTSRRLRTRIPGNCALARIGRSRNSTSSSRCPGRYSSAYGTACTEDGRESRFDPDGIFARGVTVPRCFAAGPDGRSKAKQSGHSRGAAGVGGGSAGSYSGRNDARSDGYGSASGGGKSAADRKSVV